MFLDFLLGLGVFCDDMPDDGLGNILDELIKEQDMREEARLNQELEAAGNYVRERYVINPGSSIHVRQTTVRCLGGGNFQIFGGGIITRPDKKPFKSSEGAYFDLPPGSFIEFKYGGRICFPNGGRMDVRDDGSVDIYGKFSGYAIDKDDFDDDDDDDYSNSSNHKNDDDDDDDDIGYIYINFDS